MGGDGDWREAFRPDIPAPARVYDYLLGGKDNYPADRAVGDAMLGQLPQLRQAVRLNRAFLRRAVRYLVGEAGIRQIIDIGAGLPTAGNTHEVAQDVDSRVRVVYVDHDPVVLAHARNMLHAVPGTAVIAHDMVQPEGILADPALRELIDFGQPVALMFLSVLHFVADEADPAGIIARLLAPFPAGSYVAISHGAPAAAAGVEEAGQVADETRTEGHVRTPDEVRTLVAGMEFVEPGLALPQDWRPDPGDGPGPAVSAGSYYTVLVARTPG